jgi:hypothetical protein
MQIVTLIFSRRRFGKRWQQSICEVVMEVYFHSQQSKLKMGRGVFGGEPFPYCVQSVVNFNLNN